MGEERVGQQQSKHNWNIKVEHWIILHKKKIRSIIKGRTLAFKIKKSNKTRSINASVSWPEMKRTHKGIKFIQIKLEILSNMLNKELKTNWFWFTQYKSLNCTYSCKQLYCFNSWELVGT